MTRGRLLLEQSHITSVKLSHFCYTLSPLRALTSIKGHISHCTCTNEGVLPMWSTLSIRKKRNRQSVVCQVLCNKLLLPHRDLVASDRRSQICEVMHSQCAQPAVAFNLVWSDVPSCRGQRIRPLCMIGV